MHIMRYISSVTDMDFLLLKNEAENEMRHPRTNTPDNKRKHFELEPAI